MSIYLYFCRVPGLGLTCTAPGSGYNVNSSRVMSGDVPVDIGPTIIWLSKTDSRQVRLPAIKVKQIANMFCRCCRMTLAIWCRFCRRQPEGPWSVFFKIEINNKKQVSGERFPLMVKRRSTGVNSYIYTDYKIFQWLPVLCSHVVSCVHRFILRR